MERDFFIKMILSNPVRNVHPYNHTISGVQEAINKGDAPLSKTYG